MLLVCLLDIYKGTRGAGSVHTAAYWDYSWSWRPQYRPQSWLGITLISVLACDSQQCGILTSVDSDEPVQPAFKLRNSIWCSVSSLTLLEY